MKKENILFAIAGIFLGFFGGFFLANKLNRQATAQVSNAQVSTNNPPFLNQQTQAADIKDPHPPTAQTGKPLPEVAEKIDKARNEPTNFDAQIDAGNLYVRIKGTEKAEEFFDRAAQLNPKGFENTVKLGNGYFDAARYEKAEKWYALALAEKPADTNVRTDLGITFVERAAPDYDRAIKEFQKVLETNPKFEPAIYNLGIAYFKNGDRAQAENFLSQLEAITPQSSATEKLRQIISGNSQ